MAGVATDPVRERHPWRGLQITGWGRSGVVLTVGVRSALVAGAMVPVIGSLGTGRSGAVWCGSGAVRSVRAVRAARPS